MAEEYVRIDGAPHRIVDGKPIALHPSVDVEALQARLDLRREPAEAATSDTDHPPANEAEPAEPVSDDAEPEPALTKSGEPCKNCLKSIESEGELCGLHST